jgi:hypothetical protein
MSTEAPDHDPSEHAAHNRRYMLVAVGLAVVILTFAAISITVVITTSGN